MTRGLPLWTVLAHGLLLVQACGPAREGTWPDRGPDWAGADHPGILDKTHTRQQVSTLLGGQHP